MSGLAMQVLQERIYNKLTSDVLLMADLIGGVHDEAPDKTVFPYVRFFDASVKERSSQSQESIDVRLFLEVFSRKAGRSELLALLSLIEPLLSESELFPLSGGWNLIDTQIVNSKINQNSDGRSWKATLELLALMEK